MLDIRKSQYNSKNFHCYISFSVVITIPQFRYAQQLPLHKGAFGLHSSLPALVRRPLVCTVIRLPLSGEPLVCIVLCLPLSGKPLVCTVIRLPLSGKPLVCTVLCLPLSGKVACRKARRKGSLLPQGKTERLFPNSEFQITNPLSFWGAKRRRISITDVKYIKSEICYLKSEIWHLNYLSVRLFIFFICSH